jgi:hypothetical protein
MITWNELPQTPPGVRLHRVRADINGILWLCECGALRTAGEPCDVGRVQSAASKSARRARRIARRRAEAGAVGTYQI